MTRRTRIQRILATGFVGALLVTGGACTDDEGDDGIVEDNGGIVEDEGNGGIIEDEGNGGGGDEGIVE